MTSASHLRATGDEILRLHALIEGSGTMPESSRAAQESHIRALMLQLACDCAETLEEPEAPIPREIISVLGFSDVARWHGVPAHKRLEYHARDGKAVGLALARIVTQWGDFDPPLPRLREYTQILQRTETRVL